MRRLLALLFPLLASTALADVPKQAIICVGTSLTYGLGQDSPSYPERLATALHKPVVNLGSGGDRMATIYSRWQLYALKPDGTAFPYRVVVVEGCTNDLALDSAAGSTCWDTTRTFIEAAYAKGFIIAAVKIPPRWGSLNWGASKEAERATFNALEDAYVRGTPATGTFTYSSSSGTTTATLAGVAFSQTTGTDAARGVALASAINASTNPSIQGLLTASDDGAGLVTVTAVHNGVAANAYTLAVTGTGLARSAATMSGGSEAVNSAVILVQSDTLLGEACTAPDADKTCLKVAFDYNDHLHLNGTGMQALADYLATRLR